MLVWGADERLPYNIGGRDERDPYGIWFLYNLQSLCFQEGECQEDADCGAADDLGFGVTM
jgi:hypothetical protein